MSKELEKSIKHVFDRAKEMALWYEYDYPYITKKLEEDIKLVEQALKRNEPMKPKVAWKSEEDKEIVGYRCLNCNGSLGAKLDNKPMFPNFCRHCGQKLDWSDEE